MTQLATQGAVAIDTNVFQHLLNRQDNVDSHINRLLEHLIGERTNLVVDAQGFIASEYKQQLERRLGESDNVRNEIQILRYWILRAQRRQVPVNDDDLMKAICDVIEEVAENVDRTFVYVAFRQGTTLISNDLRHIIRGTRGRVSVQKGKTDKQHGRVAPLMVPTFLARKKLMQQYRFEHGTENHRPVGNLQALRGARAPLALQPGDTRIFLRAGGAVWPDTSRPLPITRVLTTPGFSWRSLWSTRFARG